MKQISTRLGTYPMTGIHFTPLHNGQIILCELQNSERKTIEQFLYEMETLIGLWGNQPFLVLFDFRNSAVKFSPFFADSLKQLPQIENGRQAILVSGDNERKQMALFPNHFAALDYQFFQNYESALAWLEELC
ncbi:MAG: hypothetical protein SH821_00925 [Phototrophicales bacterium]|nr:hypothetical protein [Phototrophicales bacterium]